MKLGGCLVGALSGQANGLPLWHWTEDTVMLTAVAELRLEDSGLPQRDRDEEQLPLGVAGGRPAVAAPRPRGLDRDLWLVLTNTRS